VRQMLLYSTILDSKLYSSAPSMFRTKSSLRCSKRATMTLTSCGRLWTQLSDQKKRLSLEYLIHFRKKMIKRTKDCGHSEILTRSSIESKVTLISTDIMLQLTQPSSLTSPKRPLMPRIMRRTLWSWWGTTFSSKMPNMGTHRYKGW
jgi:hypothetical protein